MSEPSTQLRSQAKISRHFRHGRAVGQPLQLTIWFRRMSLGLFSVIVVAALGACASKPPADIKLKSELMASADLNPNRRGNPQPVKVHIYYLRQDDAFQIASFAALVNPTDGTIAAELIRREERLLGPGESVRLDSKFDPETRFIGVVAEFTRIENAQWRALVEVPKGSLKDKLNPFSGKKLMVALDGTSVKAEVAKD